MINLAKDKLKIALPKKGRLREPAIELFKRAGYEFNVDKYSLQSVCKNEPIEFVFLRTSDIPRLVERGIVDLGVTGSDNVVEKKTNLKEVIDLNYGQCRICLAGEGKKKYHSFTELAGKTIATSFPNITRDFFKKYKTKSEFVELDGSIEIMIKLKIADLIVDIVDTGDTLKQNNLTIWETIGEYSTVLYSKPNLVSNKRVIQVKKRLQGVLIAKEYSVLEYNINKEILRKAEEITPGFDAPTLSPLDNPSMVAVKVMIKKNNVNKVIDELELLGASAIYETEIKNFRP